MNWFKKLKYSGYGVGDWDKAVEELERELGRSPTPDEIQQRMYKKLWPVSEKEQMVQPFQR